MMGNGTITAFCPRGKVLAPHKKLVEDIFASNTTDLTALRFSGLNNMTGSISEFGCSTDINCYNQKLTCING